MAKVKQGGRNGTASTPDRAKAKVAAQISPATRAKGRVAKKPAPDARGVAARKGKHGNGAPVALPTEMRVRELDPRDVCGSRTTVRQLFRVTELQNKATLATHLVFLDRHGWYCEHGRTCPAVGEVMKLGKALVRTQ